MNTYHVTIRAPRPSILGLAFILAVALACQAATAQTRLSSGGVTYPLLAPDGTGAAPSYSFTSAGTIGIRSDVGQLILQSDNAGTNLALFSSGAAVWGGATWRINADAATFSMGFGNDVVLIRNAANILQQVNGTAAQILFIGDTGAQGSLRMGAVTQASLGTPANGSITYCSDCTVANPCAGGGTGAIAKRLNGAWVCN